MISLFLITEYVRFRETIKNDDNDPEALLIQSQALIY